MKAIRSVSSMLVDSRLTALMLVASALRVFVSFAPVVHLARLVSDIELIRPLSTVRFSRPSNAPSVRDAIATQPRPPQPPPPPNRCEWPQPGIRAPIQATSRRYDRR